MPEAGFKPASLFSRRCLLPPGSNGEDTLAAPYDPPARAAIAPALPDRAGGSPAVREARLGGIYQHSFAAIGAAACKAGLVDYPQRVRICRWAGGDCAGFAGLGESRPTPD